MQLSVNTFISLDGVMQGPGAADEDTTGGFDRGGWLVPHADADMGRIVDGWFERADAILLGRTTYQMMRTYWSQVTDPENVVAVALNTYPKYVVSSTLDDRDLWENTTVVRDAVIDAVRRLKERPGRELQVHGSWQLARTLHEAGLVDTFRLLLFPAVVGRGKRLFDDAVAPSAFHLVASETTSTGATALTLTPTAFSTGAFVIDDGEEAVAAVRAR